MDQATALRSEAITAALSIDPSRPGVGRLCQELLAEATCRPITARTRRGIFFPPSAHPIGAAGRNPWGRAGRPENFHDQ